MANWSKAAQVLGVAAMQWGSQHKDRELKAEQLHNEALRNERLDKLAERRVVNEEAMTAANVRKADLEAIKMGIENENLDATLKADIRVKIAQGDLAGAQALLAGANTGKVVAETGEVAANAASLRRLQEEQAQLAGANTGKVVAETGEVAANAASTRDLQGAQAASLNEATRQSAEVFEALGMDTAIADYTAKILENELKLLEAKDKGVLTEMRKAEQELKEFIAGTKRDEDGNLLVDEETLKLFKSGKDDMPTKELQIASTLLPTVKKMYPDATSEQHMAAAIDWATQMTQRNAVPSAIEQMIALNPRFQGQVGLTPAPTLPKLPKLGVVAGEEEEDQNKRSGIGGNLGAGYVKQGSG